MIISCQQCHKKFAIDSNLIPKNGRLLKCGSCNHEWFFTGEVIKKIKVENNETSTNEITTKSKDKSAFFGNKELEIEPNIIEKEKLEIKPNIIEKEELEIKPNIIEKEELEIKPNTVENDLNYNQPIKKKTFKKTRRISFLKFIIIFIISMISLILIIDTFKKPISLIIPNIEYILFNLYETLNDIKLFFIDLYN